MAHTLTGCILYEFLSNAFEGSAKREVLHRGVFATSLQEGRMVTCTLDHRIDAHLGSTSEGTLTLSDGPDGLHWRCMLPDNGLGHAVRMAAKDSKLKGCSFTFLPRRFEWVGEIRHVYEADLLEVGPQMKHTPQYSTTVFLDEDTLSASEPFNAEMAYYRARFALLDI